MRHPERFEGRIRVLGAAFLVLFLAVMMAVIVQASSLEGARSDYESSTFPITDLANTQRQAERLRSSVLAGDADLVEMDLGLFERQIAVTMSPLHVQQLQPATAASLRTQALLLTDLVETHGVPALLRDPELVDQFIERVGHVSRAVKEGYDREEQLFLAAMLAGVDESGQLAAALLALGALTLVVGAAFGLQLFRRNRQALSEANEHLRERIVERAAVEERLGVAFDQARGSEARARAVADELETLHDVVLAGVGGGADEVAGRVVRELVDRHGFDAIAVALIDESGVPRVAAASGGVARPELLDRLGPTEQTLLHGPAVEVTDVDTLTTILPDALVVQVAPIHAGARLLGALVIEDRSPVPRAELRAVERLADHLGLLLEAARAFDDQRALARQFQELDELKTEFVATVSHELRTPLTAIVGMAVTLDEYWERVGEDERRDMVSRMRRQAGRQQRLIDDLLTISQIQQRGISLRPEQVSLAEAARAVDHDIGVEFTIEVANDLTVWADRDHVERMLTNYLINASKYAAGARVVVRAVRREDEAVDLFVCDDGPGVPEEFRPRLFDAFSQASIGTTRTAQGVGLGLSIVRTLAVANHGRAWFRPGEQVGAVFGVTLPASVRGHLAADDSVTTHAPNIG